MLAMFSANLQLLCSQNCKHKNAEHGQGWQEVQNRCLGLRWPENPSTPLGPTAIISGAASCAGRGPGGRYRLYMKAQLHNTWPKSR